MEFHIIVLNLPFSLEIYWMSFHGKMACWSSDLKQTILYDVLQF